MVDSKSTQIDDILNSEENNDLVQEIINEIQFQENNSNNNIINNEKDVSMYQENIEKNVNNQNVQETMQNVQPRSSGKEQFPVPTGLHKNDDKDNNSPDKKNSLLDKLFSMKNLQLTLIVIGIVFVLSLPLVNKTLLKISPKLGDETQLNILGNILKSICGGVLFYVSNLIV